MSDQPPHQFRVVCCCSCGHEVSVPIRCSDRFCPVCSAPRAIRIRNRINHIIKNVKRSRGYSFKHLTLTIPNQPEISPAAREIVTSFARIRRSKLWKSFCSGGAYVLECTGNKDDYHVHIHAIIYAKFVPWEQLHALWMRCSSGRGVYIQKIPERQIVRYLTKYISKPSVDESLAAHVSDGFRGIRLFQPFGNFLHVPGFSGHKPFECPVCGDKNWLPIEYLRRTSIDVMRTGRRGKSRRSPPKYAPSKYDRL